VQLVAATIDAVVEVGILDTAGTVFDSVVVSPGTRRNSPPAVGIDVILSVPIVIVFTTAAAVDALTDNGSTTRIVIPSFSFSSTVKVTGIRGSITPKINKLNCSWRLARSSDPIRC
jgi:hypothetical protein